jgi:ABC-type uncharacterized transport system ATPase component
MKIGCNLDVFDTKEECYIMQNATREEIAERFNLTKVNVSYNLKKGYRIGKRYKLLRQGDNLNEYKTEQNYPIDLTTKWNDICKAAELIRTGKGKIVTKMVNGKPVKYTEVIK